MDAFEEFGLSGELLGAIKRLGFTEPTEIQKKAIPHIMAGKDVIGESATGSGKTLAFGCGIADKVVPQGGLQALVVTPTRELAEQVRNSLADISQQKRLRIVTVYGGVSINPQIQSMAGANVVVATPGRLLDHLERGTINLSKIKILVLDEADRMFDMGFIEDVEKIIRLCPAQRQTMLFSATILPEIKQLARKHMIQPVEVYAENRVDPSKLKQAYYDIQKNVKLSLLAHLLEHEKSGLAMVFCNTRRTADFVVRNLQANKVDATAIHGGLSQNKRIRTIKSFNSARVQVLVCTDVASRGLHVDNVSHVYNYEIPKDPVNYVHRIGRTARAGEEGKAINLVSDNDYDNFSRVMSHYPEFNIEKLEKPQVERIFVKAESISRERPRWGNRSGSESYTRYNTEGGSRQGGYGRGNSEGRFDRRGGNSEGRFSRRGGSSYGRYGRRPRSNFGSRQRHGAY